MRPTFIQSGPGVVPEYPLHRLTVGSRTYKDLRRGPSLCTVYFLIGKVAGPIPDQAV